MTHVVCDGTYMYADKQITSTIPVTRGRMVEGRSGSVKILTNELVKIITHHDHKRLHFQGKTVLAAGSAGSVHPMKQFGKWWKSHGGDLEMLFGVVGSFGVDLFKNNEFLFMLESGETLWARGNTMGKPIFDLCGKGKVLSIGSPSPFMRHLLNRVGGSATGFETFITGAHGSKTCSDNFDYYSQESDKLYVDNKLSVRQIEQVVNRFQGKVNLFRKDMNKQHNKFEANRE